MVELRITTLSEDTSHRRGLLAEHGLSFLIEYKGTNVLFDTGQGPSLVANAKALRSNLSKINNIVLSHGHYDHTGGLFSLLRRIGPRDIYAHPEAIKAKYKLMKPHEFRASGIPNSIQELTGAGADFKLHSAPTELIPGLIITGEIPRVTDYETTNPLFFIEQNDEYLPDPMRDDQSLVVCTQKGPVVITGCAHAGLVNTLKYAAKLANSDYIYALVGGTHLFEADSKRLEKTIAELKRYRISKIAANHCTGFNAQMMLKQTFGEQFIQNNTGDVLEF